MMQDLVPQANLDPQKTSSELILSTAGSHSESLHAKFKLKREAAESGYKMKKEKDRAIMKCQIFELFSRLAPAIFRVSVADFDDVMIRTDVYAQKTYGNPDGMNFSTVVIDHQKEYLVSVSGEYLNGKLASIVFVTNKKRHGPFGRTGGNSDLSYEPFNFEFGPRNLFGGFHGSVYEGSVEAIGVYVKPYEVDHFEDDYRF
ncbi:jacalin-like lectin domain-containing protein [Tanacetum coccineum]